MDMDQKYPGKYVKTSMPIGDGPVGFEDVRQVRWIKTELGDLIRFDSIARWSISGLGATTSFSLKNGVKTNEVKTERIALFVTLVGSDTGLRIAVRETQAEIEAIRDGLINGASGVAEAELQTKPKASVRIEGTLSGVQVRAAVSGKDIMFFDLNGHGPEYVALSVAHDILASLGYDVSHGEGCYDL